MNSSTLVVFISIGTQYENPSLSPMPEIGLFAMSNNVTNATELVLVFAEDKPQGRSFPSQYAIGFLRKEGGIGEISESANFQFGGGLVQNSQTRIVLDNTNELKTTLELHGVNIIGKTVYIVEYQSDMSFVPGTGESINPLYVGRIEEVTWDEAELSLSVVPNMEMQRRANVMINDSPVTIGKLDYGVNRHRSEFVKILEDVQVQSINNRNTASGNFVEIITEIPYNENTDYLLHLGFHYGNRDIYCVAEDSQEGVKVHHLGVWYPNQNSHEGGMICIWLCKALPQEHIPVWIDLILPNVYFEADEWVNAYGTNHAHNFLDTKMKKAYFVNDKKAIQEIEPYGEICDYNRGQLLPEYNDNIFTLKREITTKEWDNSQFTNINSFYYIMLKNVRELNELTTISQNGKRNLESWKIEGDNFDNFVYRRPGIYTIGSNSNFHNMMEIPIGGGAITDGNIDTSEIHGFRVNGGSNPPALRYAIEFDIDDIDKNVDFDECYLSAKTSLNSQLYASNISIRVKDGGKVSSVIEQNLDNGRGQSFVCAYNHIYNHRLIDNPSLPPYPEIVPELERAHDIDVFLNNDRLGFSVRNYLWGIIMGYKNTPISGIDFEKTRPKKLLIMFRMGSGGAYTSQRPYAEFMVHTYEVGLVLKKEIDISKYILMPTNGRLIDDGQFRLANTWGGRKTGTDLIDNPIDAIEHFRRLSNWSESAIYLNWGQGPVPPARINSWGKKYSIESYPAQIDIPAFDNKSLDEIKDLKIARQILNEEDADTDILVESLCKDFYLIASKIIPNNAWTGSLTIAQESIASLHTSSVSNVDVPVIKRKHLLSFGEIREPGASDIFLEPQIKYGYVEGLGYTKSLSISGIVTNEVRNDEEWSKELSELLAPGFKLTDGERIWKRCKNFFKRYRSFVEMPSNMVEQKWIQDYETALWKIEKMLEWQMKARIQITVPWQKGRLWRVGTHIKLSLPHVIDGEELLCVCESVKKNKQNDKVTVCLIYLESVFPEPATFITIDESGDRDIVIDESGNWPVSIVEGVV